MAKGFVRTSAHPLFTFVPPQNSSHTIDFRKYLHCALFIIKAELPVIQLIQLIAKMYDDCGCGPGRLTRDSLHSVLGSTISSTFEENLEIFDRIDANQQGYITIGNFRFQTHGIYGLEWMLYTYHFIHTDEVTDYLRSNPEYEFVFAVSRSTKTPKKQKTLWVKWHRKCFETQSKFGNCYRTTKFLTVNIKYELNNYMHRVHGLGFVYWAKHPIFRPGQQFTANSKALATVCDLKFNHRSVRRGCFAY